MSEWKAMISAPKDGSVIIAIYDDASGVKAIRWGVGFDDIEKWYNCDYSDACLQEWGGWLPCQQVKEWSKWVSPIMEGKNE
jgi:hypothetical protein